VTKIHVEIIGQGQPLVMLHGWAMHSGVWRGFAEKLAQHWQIICLDLPGHGHSEVVTPFSLENVGDALLQAIPVQHFILLGWSLGATVAMSMAERHPERVQKLIVLAGNPHFVQADDWPGVKSEVLDAFIELLKTDVQQTLIRFLALQVNGLSHGKALLQSLKLALQACPPPQIATLQAGLDILKNSDLRQFIQENHLPVSLILGDKDTLIPLATSQALQRLNPNIGLHVLEGAGHAPFLSHPQQLQDAINTML
jgi:pimeloyl-[acyl-carrier protein] methyl ester esterase